MEKTRGGEQLWQHIDIYSAKIHKSHVGQYFGFFKQGGKLVKTHTNFVVVVHVGEPGDAQHGNLCF